MVERGEGLQRVPRESRPITLGERGQLFRRARYAIHEMPGLAQPQRDAIYEWLASAAHDSRQLPHLRALLAESGVPEHLPRNAASPAAIRPKRKP